MAQSANEMHLQGSVNQLQHHRGLCKPASLQRFSEGVPAPNLCRISPNLCSFPKTFAAWLGGTRWSAKVRGNAAKVRGKAAKARGKPAKVWGWDPPRKPFQACRLAAFSERPAAPAKDLQPQQKPANFSMPPQNSRTATHESAYGAFGRLDQRNSPGLS